MNKPEKLLVPECKDCKDYGCTGGYCNGMEFFEPKKGIVCWYCNYFDLNTEKCLEFKNAEKDLIKNKCPLINPELMEVN